MYICKNYIKYVQTMAKNIYKKQQNGKQLYIFWQKKMYKIIKTCYEYS